MIVLKRRPYILFVVCALIFFGCKKKGCTYEDAQNYNPAAEKDDGSCVFPQEEPDPDPRTEFVGDYLVEDSLFLFGTFDEVKTYTLNVSIGTTLGDTLIFKNLWGNGSEYFMILTGTSFSMPSQQVSGPYYASGSGTFNNAEIDYETSGDIYINKGQGDKQ